MDTFGLLEIARNEDVPRKYLADVQNPFTKCNDAEFLERFRFTKNAVLELYQIIKYDPLLDVRSHALHPLLQLTVALRFFATGNFQVTDGDLVGVSRHTARRSIHRIAETIARNKTLFIAFPYNDLTKVKSKLYVIASFPGVIGAIDCTHIPVISPGGDNAEVFRNRKGFMSINVQAICDADRRITNIVARWPGSTHDSRIFDNSVIRDEFEEGRVNGILLGDNGYPCRKYLLTPLLNPTSSGEKRYNRNHIRTRARIEQCFSKMKQRFRALRIPLRTRLDNSLTIIVAVACLHNFAIQRKQPLPADDISIEEEISTRTDQSSSSGRAARQSMIDSFATTT